MDEYYLYVSSGKEYDTLKLNKLPELPSASRWLNKAEWSGAVFPMSNLIEGNRVHLGQGVLFMIAVIEALFDLSDA